jgi:RNA polymerase sigma-70 factor, ECF subfamily
MATSQLRVYSLGWPVIGGRLPDIRDGMEETERRRRLEVLFREHAAAVHAYVRRRTEAANADDAVSEVFAIACRRLEDVPHAALPWLLACARRVLANQRRGVRRAGALRARLAATTPELQVHEGDGLLRIALNQLSARDREVLLLAAWEGLRPAEVAGVVGCSRGAAVARLHRARKRLEAALTRLESNDVQADTMEVLR